MIPFCKPAMDRLDYEIGVTAALSRALIGPGVLCADLERQLADLTGFKYCILTNSGTSALSALGHHAGHLRSGPILVPAYGVISTANAFAAEGADIRLVDVDAETGCMNPGMDALMFAKAVCWVDFAAGARGKDAVIDHAHLAGCDFWSDSAASLGQGKITGHFATLSFSGPKPVTAGQGGAILTNDGQWAMRFRDWTDQGPHYRDRNYCYAPGRNLRMTDLQAALVLAQLNRVDAIMDERRAVFAVLKEAGALPLADPPYYYIVHVDDPEATKAKLERAGIPSRRYHRPIYHHPAYANLGSAEDFPGAEYWWAHALFLPFGQSLTVEDARRIVSVLLI